ncbi:hypothetical protein [Streptomyces sp. NPDC094031]|uniref:hypothetical protein n=1 Tax=Streptomyces sp. NPDC094031 TaxID=3155307 RepID=UPI003330E97A
MTVHDVARSLPDSGTRRDLCRAIAMLEAVLNADGERYYTFHTAWPETEELASLRNGCGDRGSTRTATRPTSASAPYAPRPLGQEMVHALNGAVSLSSAAEDAAVIGHPVGTGVPLSRAGAR